MAKLQLSMVLSNNDRTRPLLSGAIQPDGIDLVTTSVHPSEMFWRQLSFQEFDVSEMSVSSFLIHVSRGNPDWVGLPVFTSRTFFHTNVLIRTDRGINSPGDLNGKRMGVPEYQQTAALWARGVLQHEFDVDPASIEWHMERTEALSHGGATGFQPPAGVKLLRIPQEKNIGSMLASGELDATLLYLPENNLVDRSKEDFTNSTIVRRLFPDAQAEGARYYAKTGFFHINHCVVVRRTLVEQQPWVVLNLFHAFVKAKDSVNERAKELADVYFKLGLLPNEGRKALAVDPYPYGVVANRGVLETITQYSHEQGLTPRVLALNEVFAANTLDL